MGPADAAGSRGSRSDCKGRQEKKKHCVSPPLSQGEKENFQSSGGSISSGNTRNLVRVSRQRAPLPRLPRSPVGLGPLPGSPPGSAFSPAPGSRACARPGVATGGGPNRRTARWGRTRGRGQFCAPGGGEGGRSRAGAEPENGRSELRRPKREIKSLTTRSVPAAAPRALCPGSCGRAGPTRGAPQAPKGGPSARPHPTPPRPLPTRPPVFPRRRAGRDPGGKGRARREGGGGGRRESASPAIPFQAASPPPTPGRVTQGGVCCSVNTSESACPRLRHDR